MGPTVWHLTWPAVLTLLVQTIVNNIDRWMVAKLGGQDVAALGLAQNLLMFVFGAVIAISAATTALVARYSGANQRDDAVEATRQSLYFSIFLAVGVIVCTGLSSRLILTFMAGEAADLVPPAWNYLRISLWSFVQLFVFTIIIAAIRGVGDMLTPVLLNLAIGLMSAILDYLLIFGNFGFPRLGLEGAAWASAVARTVVVVWATLHLFRTPLAGAVSRLRPINWGWLRRISALGAPAGAQTLLRGGASLAFFSVLGRLSETSIAEAAMGALTIGLSIEAIAFMPGFAFASTAAAMVGQNIGALKVNRANDAAWACAGQCVIVMSILAVVFFTLADPIVALFTREPEVHSLAVQYLRISSVSEPFIALVMTLSGAFQGAGDTRTPTLITFVSMWIIRVPLAYWLVIVLDMGAVAAWWVMSGSMMLAGLVTAIAFSRGWWKDIEI